MLRTWGCMIINDNAALYAPHYVHHILCRSGFCLLFSEAAAAVTPKKIKPTLDSTTINLPGPTTNPAGFFSPKKNCARTFFLAQSKSSSCLLKGPYTRPYKKARICPFIWKLTHNIYFIRLRILLRNLVHYTGVWMTLNGPYTRP